MRCPVDNSERKVQASQINVDFLDFLELLKEEEVEVPKKRRGFVHQSTQCDIMKPEENYRGILLDLERKEEYLQRMVQHFENMHKQVEAQVRNEFQARLASFYQLNYW